MTPGFSSSSEFILNDNDLVMSELSDFQEISSSGFNRLFKVKRYGQWFVLKTLKEEYVGQTMYRQLLKKEFEMGMQFNHPSVVRYISFEPQTKFGSGILMEYIDGETLKEFLQREPSAKIKKKIAAELLSGLNYLHHLQLTHRDLKPSNIIITRNGNNAKIIDFGLSDADHYTIFKQPAGTKNYSSPEQAVGETPIDCRADIYSLGRILAEMFPNRWDAYHRIAKKCCRENLQRRYANVDAILHDLERRKWLRTFAAYCVIFVIVGVGTAALYFNGDGYQQLKETEVKMAETQVKLKETQRKLSAIQKIEAEKEKLYQSICAEIDAQYSGFENLLDTNTNLLQEELIMESSIIAFKCNFMVDSVFQTIEDENIKRDVKPIVYTYMTEKNNEMTSLSKQFTSLTDLYTSGKISFDEWSRRNAAILKRTKEYY